MEKLKLESLMEDNRQHVYKVCISEGYVLLFLLGRFCT